MKRNEQGFTLLELLVVLSLVAIIVGLFLDPIARVYDLKSRLRTFIDGAPATILPPFWFQSTVKGFYVTGKKFEGNAQHFEGETIAAFDESNGVPMPFAWDIAYDRDSDTGSLSYINAKNENLVVLEWKGETGKFSYFDPEKNKWEDEWQKSPFVKKDDFKLPSLIRFEATKDGKPVVMQAALETTRDYVKDTRDAIDRMVDEYRQKSEKENAERGESPTSSGVGSGMDMGSKTPVGKKTGKGKAAQRNNLNADREIREMRERGEDPDLLGRQQELPGNDIEADDELQREMFDRYMDVPQIEGNILDDDD